MVTFELFNTPSASLAFVALMMFYTKVLAFLMERSYVLGAAI